MFLFAITAVFFRIFKKNIHILKKCTAPKFLVNDVGEGGS